MRRLKNIILFAGIVLLSACDKNDAPSDSGRVIFASRMAAPATKALLNNTWDGGEQVFVSIDDAQAQIFTAAAGGMLTAVEDIWWQSSTQTKSARGWYPDPASWSFPADQSGGFHAADFIFAPTVTGIKYNNYISNPLIFHHLPAKIIVNLLPGTDISSVSSATISFYGYLSGTVDTDNGMITGTDTAEGWITPHRTADTETYTALLIPRDMTGTQFIKITLAGYDYYYVPASDEADLEHGNSYTYNITVDRTRLTVTVVDDGATWDDSGNTDTVTATPVE